MNFNDDNKNDYFDGPDIPEKPQEPKKPVLTPDDPRYWEEPEDKFEHITGPARRSWRIWVWIALAAILIGFLWALYVRTFRPFAQSATQYGYIEAIEKRPGYVFETYEGVLLPYKNLMDSVRPYEEDFQFSVKDPAVAAQLKRMQYDNRPVRVVYDRYRTQMPWRGETKILITRVDSVNERDILPPDRRPATVHVTETDM